MKRHAPLDTDLRPDLRSLSDAVQGVRYADIADRWTDEAARRAADLAQGDERALGEIIDAFTRKARAMLRGRRGGTNG